MIIDYVSDIHLDFYIKEKNNHPKILRSMTVYVNNILPETPGDILIIAGDIGHREIHLESLLEVLGPIYQKIFFVHGNHDMYLVSNGVLDKYNSDSFERLQNIKNIIEQSGNIYLDGDVAEFQGVRIGGCCGWYDLKSTQDLKDWKAFTNDSNLICTGVGAPTMYSYGRNLVKLDTREYYKTELEKLKNLANQGCDILVNHVAQTIPPYYELPPEYRGDPNNKFFYTENFDLVKQSGC
jgi:predicted MPP superfamily phosphohydrolase